MSNEPPDGQTRPGADVDRPRFAAPAERTGKQAATRAGRSTTTADDAPRRGPAEGGRPDGARRAEGDRSGRADPGATPAATSTKRGKRRARKVGRVVRHVDPWSVLKLSILFYLVLFLILCVAAVVLWSGGRQTGAIDNVEDFITELGVFGDCEPIDGPADDEGAAATTVPPTTAPGQVDQLGGAAVDDDIAPLGSDVARDDDGCVVGEEQFVGSFRFEGDQLLQAFVLGGLVLVLAGSAGNVVLAVLFNLMSDLTGGIRVTVLEELPPEGERARAGSPPPRRGG